MHHATCLVWALPPGVVEPDVWSIYDWNPSHDLSLSSILSGTNTVIDILQDKISIKEASYQIQAYLI